MVEHALSKRLIGRRAHRELLDYLGSRLPRLAVEADRDLWLSRAACIRHQMLGLFFRGHPPGLLEQKPRVEWTDVLETGHGYRIRKLRYEGYPGMWIPALLYEPTALADRVPAVLNPNGHHPGGKAMDYKQARSINLAKRGMLALNTEFIGMGELRADADHCRIGLLDLCGEAGIAVFYLAMKRGLDVLLDHPNADPQRVAMTGLSGGGWQTIVLSALDERIRVSVPVAGHSPVWQRMHYAGDIGDLEQVPSDLCTVADFDVLTALVAPRPLLLIYNRDDDCCFQTARTRKSVYEPVKPVFGLLGASDKLGFHCNRDPGTHNYEADNRSQLYRFLDRHFGLDTPAEDLPWKGELYTEQELCVGLPPNNATLLSLSHEVLGRVRARRGETAGVPALDARRRLAELLKVPEIGAVGVSKDEPGPRRRGCTVRHRVLCLDDTWSVPLTECAPVEPTGVELILTDGGRGTTSALVERSLGAGRRVLAADILGTGEAQVGWQHLMILAGTGERPLGVQVGQVRALVSWARDTYLVDTVHLVAEGQVVSVVGLIAAALSPGGIASLTTGGLVDTLERLIEWPLPYAQAAGLFCFGLLREFDITDLIALSTPVPLKDSGRGPLRR